MTDQLNSVGDNIHYDRPQVKIVRISTRTRILQSSIGGTPGLNDYEKGSDSYSGFGDDDE